MLTTSAATAQQLSARERILASAYELFSTRGIHAVAIDQVIERSGVAKATLYSHFPSKQELVLSFLRRREQRWTLDWLLAEIQNRVGEPEQRLLAIFDVFAEWFDRPDFEGCAFVNGLLEMGHDNPIGNACVSHLQNIRSLVADLAAEAGVSDPQSFADCWHVLMKGSIVAAAEGDTEAAQKAKSMGRLLLADRLGSVS